MSLTSSDITVTGLADYAKQRLIATTNPWKRQIMFIDFSKKPTKSQKMCRMDNHDIRFVTTSRGGENLIVDNNFKFRLHSTREDKRYWKCITENCKAKAHTDNENGNRLVHLTDHNHGPITAELASEDIVRGVKRRAVEELTPVPRIYQEEVTAANQRGDLNDEIAAHLPNLQGCSSSAYRARRRRLPMLPATRENIVLEGEWAQTADGHDFVLANDGGAEKLIIFGIVEGLLQVCRANSVYMDGTFYAVPTLFHQLYTVHAKAYGQMFPLLYGLLPNRTEDTYTRFTHLIQAAAAERNVQFDPDEILIDYEQAAIQAYRRVLPGCHVKGCLFHYGQCIHRCIQRIGLAAQYNAAKLGNPLRRWVRRTLALPLTPPDQIDLVWQNIMDDAPVIQEADQFHNYVTITWIGDNSRFSRNMWNHYNRLEESRTINALEGWHHKINSYIGKPHPNLWEFISFLKKEELFQRTELQRLEAGGRPNPRRLTYVRIDNRLANLKTQYERNERPLMSYVDAVSYLLRN